MSLSIIYETKGAAAEYAPLGLNLTSDCPLRNGPVTVRMKT